MKPNKSNLNLSGNLWFNRDDRKFLGEDRIKLLEKIDQLGSITKAAKAVGICYKNAWDTVSSINNLAEKPLVDSLTGGKGGGGTCLTEEGKRIVAQFNHIREEMRKHLEGLEEKLGDTESLYKFLHRNSMKISARNIFYGTVSALTRGAVNTEVTLTLKGDVKLTSVITNGAVDNLGLSIGKDAYAIVKASSIIVGTDLHNCRISTRNIFCGTVARIIEGSVSTEVDVEIDGGTMISAIITHESVTGLDLKQGNHACALFKASSVILGVN
ncbi:MAG: TOBE domain-containing protein [Desulfuromonadales bacterium]|nr:TOBE domain-containing protein [Desulfuromonadales bacterium]